MTAEQYEKLSAPFKKSSLLKKALIAYNYLATWGIAAIYFIALILLAVNLDVRFWQAFGAPAVGFILLTVIRKVWNRPRPYEALEIEPILDKKNKGASCPSRHAFSAFAIATVVFYLCPVAGLITAVFGALLAFARVVAGVHFPLDVILGASAGIILTALGVYIPAPFLL